MAIDPTAMAAAMQSAIDAVPPPTKTDSASIAAYRAQLTAAMAGGIASGIDPAVNSAVATAVGPTSTTGNVVEYINNGGPFEIEVMRLSFQSISWAQFAIFDNFMDSNKRASSEASGNPAVISNFSLIQGDNTPNKSFTFTSKIYYGITTVGSGSISAIGGGVFIDPTANWFNNEIKELILVDSTNATFIVASNTANTLSVAGSAFYPEEGPYSLKTDLPANLCAMCSYKDSTLSGGYGFTKLEASFDGGENYQTILDTMLGIDNTGGTVTIQWPSSNYVARITITNDEGGASPVFSDFLITTDPSPWRF